MIDRTLLAVAPFQAFQEDLALWREGMMDMLSRNFDGAGPLRTVRRRSSCVNGVDAAMPFPRRR